MANARFAVEPFVFSEFLISSSSSVTLTSARLTWKPITAKKGKEF